MMNLAEREGIWSANLVDDYLEEKEEDKEER